MVAPTIIKNYDLTIPIDIPIPRIAASIQTGEKTLDESSIGQSFCDGPGETAQTNDYETTVTVMPNSVKPGSRKTVVTRLNDIHSTVRSFKQKFEHRSFHKLNLAIDRSARKLIRQASQSPRYSEQMVR